MIYLIYLAVILDIVSRIRREEFGETTENYNYYSFV